MFSLVYYFELFLVPLVVSDFEPTTPSTTSKKPLLAEDKDEQADLLESSGWSFWWLLIVWKFFGWDSLFLKHKEKARENPSNFFSLRAFKILEKINFFY